MKLQRLKRAFKKWGWLVTSWGWKFTVHYQAGLDDMPDQCDKNTTAITFARWEYLSADIYVNLSACEDEEDDALERIVIHELLHLLVCPIAPKEGKEVEYVVTCLERTIFGLSRN